ncbi:MAG: iron chelate uptake ABC transporter family permease subunit [Actinobacteria bacterium]|nr:iron chelate uptake ABC transporter family permease subunit [Actinomycetota bacterium]
MDILGFAFMQRALVAGALVGIAAPAVGIFIVQRRLSLMGDGIGHVAFAGVAAGLVLSISPILSALVFAICGAIAIELLRNDPRTQSDMALALVFYGGIAGGVLLLGFGDVSTINLHSYLFGSVVTVSDNDLWLVSTVAACVVVPSFALRKHLFAIAYDEEVARVSGLPVVSLNIVVALLAAFAIAATAKVVGILLVASMLVLPVAAAQQVTRSFRATAYASMGFGAAAAVGGLVIAFYADVFPAATIVLLSILAFVVASLLSRTRLIG